MVTIFSNNYLANKPMENAMRAFGKRFTSDQRILDIGCGFKPYQRFFTCTYLGLDPLPETKPDVVGNAWELPFPDNDFDGLILNQSLEHIAKVQETIEEMKRVLKPGGIAIITVPQTMKNHSLPRPANESPVHNFNVDKIPYWHIDYWRFTKFGLIYLFRDFTILDLRETNGYVSSLLQLVNYFFAAFGFDALFVPIYFVNNIAGIVSDSLFSTLGRVHATFFHKVYYYVHTTLTINYILVIRKGSAPHVHLKHDRDHIMSTPRRGPTHRQMILRVLLRLRQSRWRRPILSFLVRLHNSAYSWISFFASYKGIHPKHDIIKYHKFFLDHVTPQDRILDIGCGSGAVAFDLAKKARQVVGIDFSAGNIVRAQKTYRHDNLTFVQGDATTYTFDQVFDVIVLSNVIEHIEDRVGFLKRLAALAPSLLIRVPLISRDWISVYKRNEGFEYRLDETHYIEYTEEEFRREIQEANLHIKSLSIKFGELYAVCTITPVNRV